MSPILEKFDEFIDSAFFGILSPSHCSAERMSRAKLRASLPAPHGCSLFRASDQGKVAWLSSVAACLSDPLLFSLRNGLSRFIAPAHAQLVTALGGEDSKHWSQIAHLLPKTDDGFLDGSMYSPQSDSKIKLSKSVLKLFSRMKLERYLSLTSIQSLSSTLSKSDVLRANAQSIAGRIFTTSLKYDSPFVFTNDQYLAWCRSFLGLPPANTIGNAIEHENFDYPVQRCLATHLGSSQFLDADGGHAASHCPATYAGRMKKHNYLMRVLARAAKEAGLRVASEPDTHGLLLGEFSKSECRRIFPKAVAKHYRDRFNAVINALELVASPACTMTQTERTTYVQQRIDALPSVHHDDSTGLRIDLSIENEATGETKWVDVTAVHTGSASYQDKELKAVSTRQITSLIATNLALPDMLKFEPSPTLCERTQAKTDKYSRLLLVAKKQMLEKKRRQIPCFMTFAVSDYGELAPTASDLQEWLVNQFRSKEGQRQELGLNGMAEWRFGGK